MKSLQIKELQIELTYNSLFNFIYNRCEKGMEEAIERYDHYKRLGIESIQTAKNSIIATWLYNREMSLMYAQSGGHRIDHFRSDGGTVMDADRWKNAPLRKFIGGMPIELLRRLPDNAGEKAIVFYKTADPILAYPLMYECVVEKRIDAPKWYNKDDWDYVDVPGQPGPYFIAVHRWE